jgi:uncharacterized protein YneR
MIKSFITHAINSHKLRFFERAGGVYEIQFEFRVPNQEEVDNERSEQIE